jgi:hypothetical protein
VEDVSKPFVQGQIQELNIEVDCSIEKHLRSALKRVKDENSLHGFFQVLTAFTACYKKGDNLFHKLKVFYDYIVMCLFVLCLFAERT